MAMDAMLATIAIGRRAIVNVDREAGRKKINFLFNSSFHTKPFNGMVALTKQPLF
jgi:hypothetical protein